MCGVYVKKHAPVNLPHRGIEPVFYEEKYPRIINHVYQIKCLKSLFKNPDVLLNHQTANAKGLEQAGGALLIPESALDPASLSEDMLRILTTPDTAKAMRDGALAHGMPDATERLVTLVEELSQKR